MNAQADKLAILVSSCDKYADVWDPFFELFFRNWPDCPFDVFLLANHKSFPDPRINTISVGDDLDWSSTFRKALRQIPNRYLLVLMEDYLLTQKADTGVLVQLVEFIEEQNAGYLRIYPCPGPSRVTTQAAGLEIGEIDRHESYRCSLQAALWDKQILDDLLVDGESAWDFELKGSKRSGKMEKPFLSIARSAMDKLPFTYFCTGVVKGYWLKEAVALCEQQGIAVNTVARPVEPWYIRLKRTMLSGVL